MLKFVIKSTCRYKQPKKQIILKRKWSEIREKKEIKLNLFKGVYE